MRTMAIRVEDELHAQLTLLAQLDGVPLVEEIRQAIDDHIARKRSAPDFADRAQAVLAEIDQEAAARRDAIASLFGTTGSETAEPSERPSRRRNGTDKEA